MENQPLSSGEQGKIIIFSILMIPAVFFLIGIVPTLFIVFGIFLTKNNKSFSHIKTATRNFQIYFTLILLGCLVTASYFATKIEKPQDDYHSFASSLSDRIKTEGYLSPSAEEVALDLQTLTPNQLIAKYGETVATSMMAEDLSRRNEATALGRRNFEAKESAYSFLLLSAVCAVYLFFVRFFFFGPLIRHNLWVEQNSIFSSTPADSMNQSSRRQVDIIQGEKLKQYSVADELTKWAKLKEDGHITEDEFNEARNKLLKRD